MLTECIFIFDIDWKDFSVLFAELKNLLYLISHVVKRQELILRYFVCGNEYQNALLLKVIEIICTGKAFISGPLNEFLFLLTPHRHILSEIGICHMPVCWPFCRSDWVGI